MSLTTDRNDERLKNQTNEGQNEVYLVLPEEELQKGFVRPFRDQYIHKGLSVCGKIVDPDENLGRLRKVCVMPHNHEDDCIVFKTLDQSTHAKILETHLLGGCGAVTNMVQKLSETYARDPKFYDATFCVGCNKHLPVAEFRWTKDDQVVGS